MAARKRRKAHSRKTPHDFHIKNLSNFESLPSEAKHEKHTTGGIPRWSPTLVLIARFSAYVWQSGRDAQFSLTCGRMCPIRKLIPIWHGMLSDRKSEAPFKLSFNVGLLFSHST
jgi:hypothetical protein